MRNEFKSHRKYKDSGVDWIGKLPEKWTLRRLSASFRQTKRTGYPQEQLLSVYRDYGVVPKDSRTDNFNKASEDLSGYQLVEPGDLVLNKMKTWQGSIGISAHRGIVSPAYFVAIPSSNLHPRYTHHLLRTPLYVAQYQRASKGIRSNQWDLPYESFKELPVIVPPLAEGERIAYFLDEQTAKIGEAIQEKEALTVFLLELYASAATAATTKGLNPNVRTKKAGIDWLDETPINWTRIPIKHLLKNCDYGISESLNGTGPVKVLTMAHLENGKVLVPSEGCLESIDPSYLLEPRDLLFNRTNSRDLVGKVGIFEGHQTSVTFASYLVRLRVNEERCSPEFLNYQLNAGTFLAYARGLALLSINQANLNATKYTSIRIPLPPKDEQTKIVRHLDEIRAAVNAAVTEIAAGIDALKEYRSTLIYEAVTGKIELRDE